VLDLLERFPACELPFTAYLQMLPLMTPRYYSISSSPVRSPERCSITVGVLRGPAPSGEGEFLGVCSNDLAGRGPGARINAFVKESKSGFALPADAAAPIVMIGPGTGLAPFRGFLQERRALREAGHTLGRALLFFGCRRRDEDFIYRDELETYAADGIVELHVAFSREGPEKRYVQHLIAERADDVFGALDAGATLYVCGDGNAMEPQVRAVLLELYRARSGVDERAAAAWLADLSDRKRYVLDVWATA
jgi:cytochrome P450/NADPH-cytochrome P450 reductase